MSCFNCGLWYFSTNTNNDIFHIIEVIAVTVEIIFISFYVGKSKSISVNTNIGEKSIIINEYEDTVEMDDGHQKLVQKIKKANRNSILPVYSSLLKWFIGFQIIMIIYSLCLLILSINKIAIHTVTKYIIIAFQGFGVNSFWYSFMYLIIWSFIQNGAGKKSWRRSTLISSILGIIHGIVFIYIFYIVKNDLNTIYINIGLCVFDLLIFLCLIIYMCHYPRKRYKKSLAGYVIILSVIHLIWLTLNVLSIYIIINKNICIYYIFDVIRQLIFPILLFFTLKSDSKYWSEISLEIMSSNHARLSIWDEMSGSGMSLSSSRYGNNNDEVYNEIINLAEMQHQIPILEWCCLGMDDDEDNNSSTTYIGMGTTATVVLGKYKGSNVAIKCIICDELDIESLHLFYKEALLCLSLQSRGKSHPNIVQFIGIAIQPPELCLIYEYCKHKSLTNVLKNINLYPNISYIQILYIAYDISKGMKYLHENDIVHRDLKTENILIHTNNKNNPKYPNKKFIAKICDFGLARITDNNNNQPQDNINGSIDYSLVGANKNSLSSPSGNHDSNFSDIFDSNQSIKSDKSSISNFILSSLGVKQKQKQKSQSLLEQEEFEEEYRYKPQFMTTEVGTVAFLPPEILQNVSFQDMGDIKILNKNSMYAQSMDVFSFGCILWELIMRDEVYKEYKTAQDVRNAVLNGNYPKMPQWCPDDYTNLIKACWEKNPFKRPSFQFVNNKLKQMIINTKAMLK